MPNIKILIADGDEKYIMALERRFIDSYNKQCELYIITEQEYLDRLFSFPQSFDIMIINEEMYNPEFVKHEIANIFVLTERKEDASEESEINVSKIYKYGSAKEIYNEIVSNLSSESVASSIKKGTEIISIYSPSGGSGKTTLAFGLCASLSKKYKKVLYMGIDALQSFGSFMKSPSYIQSGFEKLMKSKSDYIVSIAESIIKDELFSIIPPFQKSLAAMDIGCGEYMYLAEKLKESGKFDYIVIDGDSEFCSDISKIMSISDKVIILADYSRIGLYKLDKLLENIDCSDESKFTMVCGKYKESSDLENNSRFSISIPFIDNADDFNYEQCLEMPEFDKLALRYI
jgi:ATPase involved in chromosome partitioning-like protein